MTQPNSERSAGMERVRQRLLLAGVVLGGLLLALGGVLLLAVHGARPVDFSAFRGEPEALRSVGMILRGAAHLEPNAVVESGLLLVGFARARDLRYVGISALLFVLLVMGFVLGGG